MTFTESTRSVLAWLRAGQPAGYPYADWPSSVLVLERGRLSDGDASYVAGLARARGAADRTDVGVEITHVLDAMPHPCDVERVMHLLDAA